MEKVNCGQLRGWHVSTMWNGEIAKGEREGKGGKN